jgi:poly-gamma-glutamate capsule biosynthesis protein CapA/YwtB (metallophosphatase superfamily)
VTGLSIRARPGDKLRDTECIFVVALGDIAMSGRVLRRAMTAGATSPFAEVENVFIAADLAFGNFETPVVAGTAARGQFASERTAVNRIRDAGITHLHVANNHILDYGTDGLKETLEALKDANLKIVGAGESREAAREIAVFEKNGIRLGWLGCGKTNVPQKSAPYYWEYDEEELLKEVSRRKNQVDILAVSIHIGYAYIDYPHPDHRRMAQRLAKEGANIVLMHHAHVLQGIEITPEGSTICYNLGNFLCDWEEGHVKAEIKKEEQREGAIFKFEICKTGVSALEIIPTWIDDDYTVRPAGEERSKRILDRLTRISEDLKKNPEELFQRQHEELTTGHAFRVLAHHLKHANWKILISIFKSLRFVHLNMMLAWTANRMKKVFGSNRDSGTRVA